MRRLPPLPRDALRAVLVSQLPSEIPAGAQHVLDVTLENRGPHAIATVDPNPVQLGSRWFRGDGVCVRQSDYPYPARWRRVFERPHPIQRDFFEALYATRDGVAGSRSGCSGAGS